MIKTLLFKCLLLFLIQIVDDTENLTPHTVVIIQQTISCVIKQRRKFRWKKRNQLEILGGQNEFPNSNLLRVVGDAVLVVKVLEVGRDRQFDVPGFGPVVGILNPYALKGPVDD